MAAVVKDNVQYAPGPRLTATYERANLHYLLARLARIVEQLKDILIKHSER